MPLAGPPPRALQADVIVAGAGISGVFAALAAARAGAHTVLVERFGALGGNIGPGMIWGGSLDKEADYTLPGGMAGLGKEFVERLRAMVDDAANDAARSAACSHLLYRMMQQAGVTLMLGAWAAAPIVRKGRVRGLWAETASGRVAVRAKVTVDATGVASLAAAAGAPIIAHVPPKPSYAPIVRPKYMEASYPRFNEAGLVALVTGVDFAAYNAFLAAAETPSEDDQRWAVEHRLSPTGPLVALLRRAFESGEYDASRELLPNVHLVTPSTFADGGDGLALLRLQARGELDIDDWRHVSAVEGGLRAAAWEYVALHRRYVPGCARAQVVATSPFVGTRGGPCIEAEHVLTPEEAIAGARHDDVLFVNIHESVHGGAKAGYDFPYRCLLPKGLDGLLVTGRGAGYERRSHDPSGARARPAMMALGQATGAAAALAVGRNETPRTLDVKALQRRLVAEGLFLGDARRLAELGIA